MDAQTQPQDQTDSPATPCQDAELPVAAMPDDLAQNLREEDEPGAAPLPEPAPEPAGTRATSHPSFLDRLGHLGLDAVTRLLPASLTIAKHLEPEISLIFPAEGPIFALVTRAIAVVEVAGRAGAAAASGESKLEAVTGLVGPYLHALAAHHQLPEAEATPAIKRYIEAAVAIYNGPSIAEALRTKDPTADTPCMDSSERNAEPHESGEATSFTASAGPVSPCAAEAQTEQVALDASLNKEAQAAEVREGEMEQTQPRQLVTRAAATGPLAPNRMTNVIDLSHNNGEVDLANAKSANIHAVIHKATQGNLFRDPNYETNRQKAQDAGLLWGAYHFGTGGSGAEQAKHFLSISKPQDDTLLALDFEKNPHGEDMSLAEARDFVTYLRQQTGRWPGLYAGWALKQILKVKGDDTLSRCWLWLAQYDDHPTVPKGWSEWTLWQYTDGTYGTQGTPVEGLGIFDRSCFRDSCEVLSERWKRGTLAPGNGA